VAGGTAAIFLSYRTYGGCDKQLISDYAYTIEVRRGWVWLCIVPFCLHVRIGNCATCCYAFIGIEKL
jgi:hypothetical protein